MGVTRRGLSHPWKCAKIPAFADTMLTAMFERCMQYAKRSTSQRGDFRVEASILHIHSAERGPTPIVGAGSTSQQAFTKVIHGTTHR